MPHSCPHRTATAQTPRLHPSFVPVIPPVARGVFATRRSHRQRSFVRAIVAAALLIGGNAAHADPVASMPQNVATAVDSFAAIIAEASRRFGIPVQWIRAVIQVESVGDAHALSPNGAMGLMQIIPETWAALRSRYNLGDDPFDAHDNILAGAAYLRELYDRYGSPGFLAAYNAGPVRYEDNLATGRRLPAETQAYVAALTPMIDGESIPDTVSVEAAVRSWTDAPLFVVHTENSSVKSPASSDPRSDRRSNDNPAADWTGLAPQSAALFISTSQGNRQP